MSGLRGREGRRSITGINCLGKNVLVGALSKKHQLDAALEHGFSPIHIFGTLRIIRC